MNLSLYQTAAALNATSRWQDLISQNLAASTIPGFKKQDLSFEAVRTGLSNANSTSLMPTVVPSIDFQPGDLKATGLPTDLAIDGKGFFQVQLPNGSHAYTRDGEFHVSAQGEIVTKQGYRVLSRAGPIFLDPKNASPITVSNSGDISQGPDPKGTLELVDFSDAHLLTPISAGYFLASDPKLKEQPSTASVRQGYLEMANTSSVKEMANLISAMRHFEANQRVLQMQDERMGRVISELGNPS